MAKNTESINAPHIVSVLDISTGHITKEDDTFIKEAIARKDSPVPLIAYGYEEGYFVYVPQMDLDEDLDVIRKSGLSVQFCKILRLAAARGLKYVQFDCDGTTYSDLKTYNW